MAADSRTTTLTLMFRSQETPATQTPCHPSRVRPAHANSERRLHRRHPGEVRPPEVAVDRAPQVRDTATGLNQGPRSHVLMIILSTWRMPFRPCAQRLAESPTALGDLRYDEPGTGL